MRPSALAALLLAGPGPAYAAKDIHLIGGFDLKPIPVASGSLTMTPDRRSATFALAVSTAGKAVSFERNGTYRMTAEK